MSAKRATHTVPLGVGWANELEGAVRPGRTFDRRGCGRESHPPKG